MSDRVTATCPECDVRDLELPPAAAEHAVDGHNERTHGGDDVAEVEA